MLLVQMFVKGSFTWSKQGNICKYFALMRRNLTGVTEQIHANLNQDYGFYYFEKNNESDSLSYGALSREIMRNWSIEWWKTFVVNKGNTIGLGIIGLSEHTNQRTDTNLKKNMLQRYSSLFTKPKQNFCVALIEENGKGSDAFPEFLKCGLFSKSNNMQFENFVKRWTTEQASFFKQYFFDPKHVKLSNGSVINDNKFSISFNTCEEDLALVNSTVISNEKCKSMQNCWSMHTVTVTIHLQNLLLSTLYDAQNYRTKLRIRRPDAKLMFINRLAPIKCHIISENQKAELTENITQLVIEITEMLRTKNISCWYSTDHESSVDEIGIPFTIVVPDSVLENGIVFLKDIATGTSMEVPLPNIDRIVLKYLHLD